MRRHSPISRRLSGATWTASLALVTALGSIALGSAACGGTPPPTETPKPMNTVAEPSGPGQSSAPDMSPVAAPKNVVLLLRANDVAKSIASADKLVKLSKPIRELVDAAVAEEKADFVSLTGSFDTAVALDPASTDKDPKFVWALSIPIKSVEETAEHARKDGDEVRSSTPGAYRLRTKNGKACDITPAPGDAPARLICSDDEEGLRELSAWLARGVTTQPKKSADLWLRADAAPLKEKYLPLLRAQADDGIADLMKELRGAPISLDPELLEVPNVLAREAFALGDDVDSFEMSFSLDANKPEMRTQMTLGFKSRTSWTTDLLAKTAERPDAPPEMFFRLPKDAMTATWSRAADPATFAGIRRVFHKGATAGLSFLPMLSEPDRQAFVSWIDGIPTFTGMWVSSSGGSGFKPTPKGKLTAAQAIDQAKDTAKQWIPWGVAGGEGDPAAMIAWLKQTETAYGRGLAVLKKEGGAKAAKDLALMPTMKLSANVAGYPKGTTALDVEFKFSSKDIWDLLPQNKFTEQSDGHWGRPEHPKGAEARGSITLRVIVVPDDAGHYWFGYSVDPDQLKKQILAAQKGAPAAGTIASRTDLGLLKAHKGFGGFFSYGSLLSSMRNADLSSNDAKDFEEAMSAMPHKGQSPLFFLGSGTPGSSPTITLDIVAPKDWVEDMAGVVQHFAAKELDKKRSQTATPPVAVAGKKGKLPIECQQYLTKIRACSKKLPERERASLDQSTQTTEDAWAQAAAEPAGADALKAACKAAADAIKQSPPCK